MRTKILGTVLVVMVAIGGLQVFQNLYKENHYGDYNPFGIESATTQTKLNAETVSPVRLSMSDSKVMIEETFKVDSGDNLIISVSHADVEIQTNRSNRAEIEVRMDARRMERATERFEAMEWSVYQKNGEIVIEADSPRGNWSNLSMDINVLVTIPSTFNLELETSHGDVDLDDLMGTVKLLTSRGDVIFSELEGDFVRIKSSHGDISGASVRSKEIYVRTSHADIDLDEIYSGQFSAATSHADISVGRIEGDSDLSTSHGDIEAFIADKWDATFETKHGDIEIMLDADAGVDFDLRASEIEVSNTFSIKGRSNREVLEGAANGGGRNIRARTTHGSIEVDNR